MKNRPVERVIIVHHANARYGSVLARWRVLFCRANRPGPSIGAMPGKKDVRRMCEG